MANKILTSASQSPYLLSPQLHKIPGTGDTEITTSTNLPKATNDCNMSMENKEEESALQIEDCLQLPLHLLLRAGCSVLVAEGNR